jgi:hypothetical protein
MSNNKGDSLGEALVSLRIGAITQQFRTQRVKNLAKVGSTTHDTAAPIYGSLRGCIAGKSRKAGRYRGIRDRPQQLRKGQIRHSGLSQ